MTDPTVMLETLARRRLALVAQREQIDAAIEAVDAQILDAIEVGGKVVIDGTPVYKVSQRNTFSVELARQVCPVELIEAATVPTIDPKVLRHLLPPALVAQCSKPGRPFVAKA